MNVTQEFEPLYRAARALDLRDGTSPAALVTITRTRGSTFRRAGASMLVQRDGPLVCELSGGCPQRDIVLRAQQAMENGQPALVAYGRESNFDVMLETGCGGELEVLIEPWRQPDDVHFLDAIAQLRERRLPGAMASVFASHGDPLPPRTQRLVHSEQTVWSNIGHAALSAQILAELTTSTMEGTAAIARPVESSGQRYDILLESLRPPLALVVIGDGIGAEALARLSLQLGWHTTLVNHHESTRERIDGIRQLTASPRSLVSRVTLDSMTSVVVMTHRLEHDLAYLGELFDTPVAYIGAIGSRQRAEQMRASLPRLDPRLHAPAGLDVGSETPEEIALAIAAEILATRNGRSGGSLVHSQAPIHP